jgi:hypothetical protein
VDNKAPLFPFCWLLVNPFCNGCKLIMFLPSSTSSSKNRYLQKNTHAFIFPYKRASYFSRCRLGGVTVSVLATGPKIRGFNPSRDDGFLRAIRIRSTPSLGGEVKLSAPCHKILRHVKKITSK